MGRTLYRSNVPYNLNINSNDQSGNGPAIMVIPPGGIFVASDQDPAVISMLTSNTIVSGGAAALAIVPTLVAGDVPLTELPVVTQAQLPIFKAVCFTGHNNVGACTAT